MYCSKVLYEMHTGVNSKVTLLFWMIFKSIANNAISTSALANYLLHVAIYDIFLAYHFKNDFEAAT